MSQIEAATRVSLADELFKQEVVMVAESYQAWVDRYPEVRPSGIGYAQLIYALAEKYRDYQLLDAPESIYQADRKARGYIQSIDTIPEGFWQAPVDVVDKDGAEMQITLRQFVADMDYQSVWARDQRQKQIVLAKQARGEKTAIQAPIPGMSRKERSHLNHDRADPYYDKLINIKEETPFDHWWRHYRHRHNPEAIGLKPWQNDGAMDLIYQRLNGAEQAWADQLMQQG